AALVAIDVAVATRVDIAAACARDTARSLRAAPCDGFAAATALRHARRVAGAIVRDPRRAGPVIAALHRRAAPAAVHVRSLTRPRVGAGPRIVRIRVAACTIWSPRD